MTLTRHLNDPRAGRLTGPNRHESLDINSTNGVLKSWEDARGQVLECGRGVTDPRVTYTAQYNTNGVKCYRYPNAAGNGDVVTTVAP